MDLKKKIKRKGEWHSAWGSSVEHRLCERGHKQASKSLQGAHPFCLDPGGVGQGHANIRLLSQHLFCYWVLHRNSESSSSDLKAV